MNKSLVIDEIKKIMDSVRIPIMVYDLHKHTITFVNEYFIQEIGYDVKNIPTLDKWFKKAYPDDGYRNAIKENWQRLMEEALLHGEKDVKQTVKICTGNYISKWFEVHRNVVEDAHIFSFNDIDKLYKQNEQLVLYNEQVRMLLSIISHDVRTPLASLKAMIDNYEMLALTKRETKRLFSSISQEINKTFHLVDTALLWVTSNNETFSFNEEPINLWQFFSTIKDNYLPATKEKNVTIKIHDNKNNCINYDVFILEVVCRNIIHNAIKFCKNNGNISIAWQQLHGYKNISIEDDGPGMPEETIDNILMNRKNHSKKKDVKKGFGVGLKLIHQVLKKYNGELTIESKINKGSRFTIKIPATDCEKQIPSTRRGQSIRKKSKTHSSLTISEQKKIFE